MFRINESSTRSISRSKTFHVTKNCREHRKLAPKDKRSEIDTDVHNLQLCFSEIIIKATMVEFSGDAKISSLFFQPMGHKITFLVCENSSSL